MTLEADVIEILLQYDLIQPSQIRKNLVESSASYKSEDNRTLDVQISRVLKRLADSGNVEGPEYVKRQAFYSITNLGRKNAALLIAHDKIRDSTKMPPEKSLELMLSEILSPMIATGLRNGHLKSVSDAKTVSTLHEVTPEGKAPVDIALWLDPANKGKIEVVTQSLKEGWFLESTAYHFVEHCKKAIVDATASAYRWNGWASGPPQYQKMIETVRTSLDFDAILMLQFNGKKFAEKYDWQKDLRKYEEHDKIEKEKAEKFTNIVNKAGSTREAWKEYTILEWLTWINRDLEIFNNNNHAVSSDTSSLAASIAEHIAGLMKAGKILHEDPKPPSVEEIMKKIQTLIEDGTLKIAFTLQLDEEKANKKKSDNATQVHEGTGYWIDPAVGLAKEIKNQLTSKSNA